MNNIQGCDYLVLDISNLLYRCFYSQKNEDQETISGMAVHIALTTVNKYFKQYKPKKRVVMCFDRGSWRKEYTASEQCLSKKPYKGNRRQDMSPAQQLKWEQFKEHLVEFERLIEQYTTIVTLYCERLEADDLMAGFVQQHPNDNIIIVTADSDMAQLFKYENVDIVSPITDKPQSLSKFNNDPKYYLYQKCLRGDTTDNIQSAYPRLRTTRIEKSYNDPYDRANLMNEVWTDQNKTEYVVGDMFKENQILIDLEYQPDDIKQLIIETINTELSIQKKFSMFHILKFLTKYELNKIKDSIDLFIPMLSKRDL
jgi:hypothetical protein